MEKKEDRREEESKNLISFLMREGLKLEESLNSVHI